MKSVEIFFMGNLVGKGVVVNFIEGKKMPTGFKEPSRIAIKLTSNLLGNSANSIVIGEKVQYHIELDENISYYKDNIITGSVYGKLNL